MLSWIPFIIEKIVTFKFLTDRNKVVDFVHGFRDAVELGHVNEGGLIAREALIDLLGEKASSAQAQLVKVDIAGQEDFNKIFPRTVKT